MIKAPTFLLLRCSENILTWLSLNFSGERKTWRLSFPIPGKKWPRRRKKQSGEEINEGAAVSYSDGYPLLLSPFPHLFRLLTYLFSRRRFWQGEEEVTSWDCVSLQS